MVRFVQYLTHRPGFLCCMNEHLPINSVGYLYVNSLCAANAKGLNNSQKNQDGVPLIGLPGGEWKQL